MLQGINFQSDMYSAYNRIQIKSPDQDQSLQSLNGQGNSTVKAPNEEVVPAPREMDLRLDDIKPRPNLSIEDISLSLNESSASFDMKGKDSDIASLDMEKAISDMKKDSILEEYQYFVGDSKNLFSDDGIVIAK